jgi:dihydrodipicolinate synthase/N-acetylneuraminate lyase
MLGLEERKLVAEVVIREAAGKVPIVVQVGRANTPSTIELAKHAERAGADAVASLTPYYYKQGDRAVAKHFERVAAAVGIPLFAYNIPQFTGYNLQPASVAALAKSGTISGVKDSSRDVLQLLDLLAIVPQGFVVMNGTEEYALFAIMMGGDGLVSGGANAMPELFESLVSHIEKKEYQAALAAQQKILEFKDAVKSNPVSSYYEILRLRGVNCGIPREPFLPLENSEKAKLSSAVKRFRVV